MNVNIVDRQRVTVACLRYAGPYGEGISRFWQDVYYPWAKARNLLDHARYGISHDDPATTPPDKCRYDAAVEVPGDFKADGGAFMATIPGGQYATLKFDGPPGKIAGAWHALMHDWLPRSEYELGAHSGFEYYPPDAGGGPEDLHGEICIPVVSRKK